MFQRTAQPPQVDTASYSASAAMVAGGGAGISSAISRTFSLDRNPFHGSTRPLHEVKRGLTTLPPGAFVAWDSYFGPAEAGLPLDVLMGRPNLELLRSFKLEGDKERSGPAARQPEVHVFRVR